MYPQYEVPSPRCEWCYFYLGIGWESRQSCRLQDLDSAAVILEPAPGSRLRRPVWDFCFSACLMNFQGRRSAGLYIVQPGENSEVEALKMWLGISYGRNEVEVSNDEVLEDQRIPDTEYISRPGAHGCLWSLFTTSRRSRIYTTMRSISLVVIDGDRSSPLF